MAGIRSRKNDLKSGGAKVLDSPETRGETKNHETEKKTSPDSFLAKLGTYLFEREDGSYLGVFRILWGMIMMYEISLLLGSDLEILISRYYLNPYMFAFKYYGFEWVTTIQYPIMVIGVRAMMLAAFCMTIGFFYSICSKIFFLGICYLFLIESTNYLNHMYLVCVLSGIFMFLPLGRFYSISNCLRVKKVDPTVPRIIILFLRAVLLVVYTYAGVVKINEDWLRAEPLRHWLGVTDDTIFGEIVTYESFAYMISYGGILCDFLIGPMMVYSKTRWIGVIMCIAFHLLNKTFFSIGIFPYVMISTVVFFLPADFFSRLVKFITWRKFTPVVSTVPFRRIKARKLTLKEQRTIWICVVFLILWVALPLRHFAYEGDVAWNESGHTFSWRMKLRDKHCHSDFFVYHPATGFAYEAPSPTLTLSPYQYAKYINRPWYLIQYAHYLADILTIDDIRPEIFAYSTCQLNYRARQDIIDPTVNLADVDVWSDPWYVPKLIPLGEEVEDQYPWNWEWNFNWLYGINDGSNLRLLATETDHQTFNNKEATKSNRLAFQEFIAEGEGLEDPEDVELHRFVLPTPTNEVGRYFWMELMPKREGKQNFESKSDVQSEVTIKRNIK